MRVVRRGVFETNSSSTHAVCVTKNNILDQKLPKTLKFDLGDFGWEVEKYKETNDKARYLYTAIAINDKNDLLENITKHLEANNVLCKFQKPKYDGGYLANGCIDHNGDDLIEFIEAVCSDEKTLMRYLFSSESFVVTGNDNSEGAYAEIGVSYDCDEYYKGN